VQLARGEYYGQIVAHQEGAGVRLSESRHAHGGRLPDHTHEGAYFCLVLDGAYREPCGTTERTYRPFSCAFYPAALTHRVEICQTGARFFTVELSAAWQEEQAELGPNPVRGVRALGSLLQLYSEFSCVRSVGSALDDPTLEALTAEVIVRGLDFRAAAHPSRPRWMPRVIEYIDAHYTRPISVGVLAASVGVHRVYLARAFRRVHGCTVVQYQNALRVRHACALLGVRDLPLSQIARDTGFADQSHFTRVFTATIGRTPGAIRCERLGKVRTYT
jgi:AraC family transcriptional regulator